MSPFAKAVLDNVTEEIRPQVAHALGLAAASDPHRDLLDVLGALADRTLAFVGEGEISPLLDCDLEMQTLARAGLAVIAKHREASQ